MEWVQENFSRGNHWIVEDEVEGFYILTEFLGINHNVTGTGPPLWFETIVFRSSAKGMLGVKIEYGTVRYSTMADALAGHAVSLKRSEGAKSESLNSDSGITASVNATHATHS